MALNIGEKKDVVKEISEIASTAQSAVAAEYRGLTVTELSALRSNARELGVYVKVCLLYTSPSPRDVEESRMPSSA